MKTKRFPVIEGHRSDAASKRKKIVGWQYFTRGGKLVRTSKRA